MMEDSVLTIDGVPQVAKRKPGRPAMVTLDVIDQIARLIAKGMTEEQACVRVGVNHCSFRTARSRNLEYESAIKRAQAEYLDESLDMIGNGKRGWQGRVWILERRHKPQFCRTPDSVISLGERPPKEMSDEELMAIVRQGFEGQGMLTDEELLEIACQGEQGTKLLSKGTHESAREPGEPLVAPAQNE